MKIICDPVIMATINDDLRSLIFDYIIKASLELKRYGYDSEFYFNIKTCNDEIIIYLYYPPSESDTILTWQIYLLEKLGKRIKKAKLDLKNDNDIYSGVTLIIECDDLWRD